MLSVLLLSLAAMSQSPAPPRPHATPPPRQAAAERSWTERPLRLPIVRAGVAYVPKRPTTRVALFLSGDGGWNLGVVDMARRLANGGALVIGVSYPALRKATATAPGCWYPAGDLEVIAQAAEKQLGLPEYRAPLLVGYSSGATLVYGALVAAPRTTFAGGMSLGFCPDLPVDRPVCSARDWRPPFDAKKREAWLPVSAALTRPWYILQGVQDQVCPFDATKAFLAKVPDAHLIEIDGTGHGFGRPEKWAKDFDESAEAVWRRAEQPPPPAPPPPPAARELEAAYAGLDLPLVFRWVDHPKGYLLFVSGDGGWAALDQGIAQAVSDAGVAVIGLNSLRYFWREKSPARVSEDLRRLVAPLAGHGLPVFAGGYSFGASVLPAAVAAWPAAERAALAGLVLVSPDSTATYEIDPLDWVRASRDGGGARVAPALRAMGLPTLCIAGADEDSGACLDAGAAALARVVRLPGSHHYRGDYARLGRTVRDFMAEARPARSADGFAGPPR